MYINRHLETTIEKLNKQFKVLLLTGARQVGKTTLLQKLAGTNRIYITLDDIAVRSLAINEPALFLERYTPPLLIDEIQLAPQLLSYLKIYADSKGENGDFWLTGSQSFSLMEGVKESLAGRVCIINLLGLSSTEIAGVELEDFLPVKDLLLTRVDKMPPVTMNLLFERIWRGSMPMLNNHNETDWNAFYASYVQTYLQRDVKELMQINDELVFYKFLCAVAASTGRMINYAALAKEAEITAPTAKQWLKILVASGIVYLLEPLQHSSFKYMVKAPKVYFLDTGLAAYLTRWNTAAALEMGAMGSNFFETWVVSEIYKSFTNMGQVPPLHYYRDFNSKEIELLIQQNGCIYPLAIRKSALPNKEVKKFEMLQPITKGEQALSIGSGGVVCLASDLLPIDSKNWYIPAWLL